jgi:HlyD family secretion protein
MLKLQNMKLVKKLLANPNKLLKWFLSLSWKKKIIVVILAIILVSIAISQIIALTKPPGYTLAKAEKQNITEIVTETGNISSGGIAHIFSPTNGLVSEIYVTNGDTVIDGQDLLKVESTATVQEQQSAYANYLTAVATLNAAKSNLNVLRSSMYTQWETFRNLATNDTYEDGDNNPKTQNREATEFQVAQDNWLAAEAKYKDQQTVVGQASAAVSSTWLAYQATQNAVIKAVTNGTVTNLSVALGSTVEAQTALLTATPVLTIANLTTTEIVVSLSETDITKVKENQKVTIDVSSVNDKTYNGIIRRVDTVGSDDQGVIRYNAYVEVTDPDESLRPGMSADVQIITKEINNVLTVPNSAVKPYQGGRAVRVINPVNKQIEYIPVEIGVRGEEYTQILKGIEEGREVVTALSNEQIQRPGLF